MNAITLWLAAHPIPGFALGYLLCRLCEPVLGFCVWALIHGVRWLASKEDVL